jgi:hypothetical protein
LLASGLHQLWGLQDRSDWAVLHEASSSLGEDNNFRNSASKHCKQKYKTFDPPAFPVIL